MLKRRHFRFRAVPYLGMETGPLGPFKLAGGWLRAVIVLDPFHGVTPPK